jgi:hypothetical protein
MVIEYENTLRRLITSVLGSKDDSPFKISEDRIEKWKEKREIETKKKKGVSFEKRLIYYSDFYDLKNIILKNWELFTPIITNKKRFEVFFEEMEKFRNTAAHGRNLTKSEENLAKGITSDLKNLITIYHNKNEMKDDFFVQIIKINDNLGTVWEEGKSPKKPILRVGDEYELVVEANDPKDREIEYQLLTIGGDLRITQKNNRFNFIIENKLVSETTPILVVVRTPSSEYKNEATISISIMVLPK